MSTDDVQRELKTFVETRNWGQFHTPENLAKSISIEAGELLECFQWNDADATHAKDELADVLTYCYLLANKLQVDPETLILQKLKQTEQKYPVDKSFGVSTKYDRL